MLQQTLVYETKLILCSWLNYEFFSIFTFNILYVLMIDMNFFGNCSSKHTSFWGGFVSLKNYKNGTTTWSWCQDRKVTYGCENPKMIMRCDNVQHFSNWYRDYKDLVPIFMLPLTVENLDYLNCHPREKVMKSDGVSGQFSCPTSLPKGKDFFRVPHNQDVTVPKSFAERATSCRIPCN